MILPVYAYGQPVLKQLAADIDKDYPNLTPLLKNMWETLYDAAGVGLAAPQIGQSIRLFIVDTEQLENEDKPNFKGFVKVFINARKVEETGEKWAYEEGCLSIPNIRGEVSRQKTLTLRYLDENFEEHTETFTDMNARVIQHEYDHIDGILFIEHFSPIKRNLIRTKLESIKRGKVKDLEYRMKFPMK